MGRLPGVRARLRQEVVRRPEAAARISAILHRLGALALAAKFDHALGRGDDELYEITPPTPVAGIQPFRMYRAAGSDQIVRDIEQQGWAAFEAPLPDVFAALIVADPGVVLDVGANSGFYALLAAAADPAVRVAAFEPYPPVAAWLRRNLDANDRGGHVTLVEKAVGAEAGTASLYVPTDEHHLLETSASLNPTFKEVHSRQLDVEVVTLDEFATGHPGRVTLVKVDVESMEHAVLAGAGALLDRDRPVVVVEVLPKGDIDALEAIRARHDLVDVRLRPGEAVVGQPVAFDPDAWNHLFVPVERLDAVLERLADVTLSVSR